MRTKIKLCGVNLSQINNQKTEIISAITWLDVKISELMRNSADELYIKSKRLLSDYSEIIGVLKFLYMARVITEAECNLVKDNITTKVISEDLTWDQLPLILGIE